MTGPKGVSVSELKGLMEQQDKPDPLTYDQVQDYATASLVVLRGLSRKDKLRVINRMRKVLG